MANARDQNGSGTKVRRLSDAVRRVRIAEAERTDAFADLYDAEKARIAMLADELAGVFSEIPESDDYFICQIGGGVPPRLWVDPTAHVVIGRDRRSYRFLKDTRLGRVVLGETADLQAMADLVTDYVAERVIERDRAQETDLLLDRVRQAATPRSAARTEPDRPDPRKRGRRGDDSGASEPPSGVTALWALIALLFGIAVGAAGIIAYAWFVLPM